MLAVTLIVVGVAELLWRVLDIELMLVVSADVEVSLIVTELAGLR